MCNLLLSISLSIETYKFTNYGKLLIYKYFTNQYIINLGFQSTIKILYQNFDLSIYDYIYTGYPQTIGVFLHHNSLWTHFISQFFFLNTSLYVIIILMILNQNVCYFKICSQLSLMPQAYKMFFSVLFWLILRFFQEIIMKIWESHIDLMHSYTVYTAYMSDMIVVSGIFMSND